MLDQSIKPDRCQFCLIKLDSDFGWSVAIGNLDNEEDDDVTVDHEEFNKLFGHEAECVYGPWEQKYISSELKALVEDYEIRSYLISIGMIEVI